MIAGVHRRMLRDASADRATVLQRFFKTAPGEYGHGDRFLGLNAQQIRAVAREYRSLSLSDLSRLLDSEWHEERVVALVIAVEQFGRGNAAERKAIYDFYLRRTDRINNWDLVDVSAPSIVGGYVMNRSRAVLTRLAKSRSLWERRIAILATFEFIRSGEYEDTLRIAEILLHDDHDLIHKAVGWMRAVLAGGPAPLSRRHARVHGGRALTTRA